MQPESQSSDSPSESDSSSGWTFTPETDEAQASPDSQPPQPEITWSASEYIAHQKGAGWYALFGIFVIVAGILVYFMTKDKVPVIMIGIAAIAFIIFASRPPRTLFYKLDHSGVTIENKHYPFAGFKSFSIQEEDAVNSLLLIPLKRFMPGTSLYYPPEQEEEIINTLSQYLPHEERPPDAFDRFMRKVRF